MAADDDDSVEDADPFSYEDPIAQRAAAFVQLARCADTLENETARELCFTMLRKITASVKTPSTADVRLMDGGRRD